jgi:hypothetical protein
MIIFQMKNLVRPGGDECAAANRRGETAPRMGAETLRTQGKPMSDSTFFFSGQIFGSQGERDEVQHCGRLSAVAFFFDAQTHKNAGSNVIYGAMRG